MAENHSYPVRLSWSGSTGVGYDEYGRAHEVAPGDLPPFPMSSDPHFRGDPSLVNPEQLLVMSASSCQLLSFLAVAARSRLDVLDYVDNAEGLMPESSDPMWVTEIRLRPTVTLAPGSRLDRLERLVTLAHQQCFIANSLRSRITVDARFVIDGAEVARVQLTD
ncbi:OsmC family peroxiredoxin [Flexivirga sp. ID2601S]|uniref:OsmC family peroxiredoxin n=1 Tax=Flexivirga aerilata TaxID=1656889 RepID=A0A849AP56_9MICO|nr:OsmC family protein [Flexivirga aerilata]NNG38572.1 OsmC family peroxiredoxin [Flexivirga aerilata]